MPEKVKKIRLFKLAKEFNVGHETLFEQLSGFGFEDLKINSAIEFNEKLEDTLRKLATTNSVDYDSLSFVKKTKSPDAKSEEAPKLEEKQSSRYDKILKQVHEQAIKFKEETDIQPKSSPKTARKKVQEPKKETPKKTEISKPVQEETKQRTTKTEVETKKTERFSQSEEYKKERESRRAKTENPKRQKRVEGKREEIQKKEYRPAERNSERPRRTDSRQSEQDQIPSGVPPESAKPITRTFGNKKDDKFKDSTDAKPKTGFRKDKEKGRNFKFASTAAALEASESAGRRKKRKKKNKVDQANVSANIKETLARMSDTSKRKKHKKEVKSVEEGIEQEENVIRVSEFISASELAAIMEVDVTEIITKCFSLGLMITINQRLDLDTITLLADEFGYKVETMEEYEVGEVFEEEEEEDESLLEDRPPIVTVMGHVDHGKTSLLDYVRKANVVAGEAGGITQHIGAYEVEMADGHNITFLDTPGHEAFTAMRSRGAQVTDIVILIVAADDSVMPQTVEAIHHAQAANVPIVIAINKIDKEGANPEKIKTQLSEKGLLVEEWGGKYQAQEISAKSGLNVDKLLELVALEAEVMELKANPTKRAQGIVIEAELDKGRGPVATVLITNGTLKIQDSFVCGAIAGRVRAMLDERGNTVTTAPPSTPVQILGFEGVPQAGDKFDVMPSDREAREIATKRNQLRRERQYHQNKIVVSLDEISQKIKLGMIRELPIIIKGDVDGSVEALADSLQKISTDEVAVKIIHKGVGVITEADVLLASTSGAIIIGFQVRPNVKAREVSMRDQVDIRLYRIIYDAISEVKTALEGLLAPTQKEEILGFVEIRDTFKVPKIGTIAGCHVMSGKVNRNSKIRVVRNDAEIYDGTISSLKRFKDDVKEVATGFECGIGIANFDDVKPGDVLEVYHIIEIKRKLT
ncbi:MAG: translation initiation factor IF-2 [Calditrichaeota bacterium]|nr:MAG: translation initiation factor IF-2 [Calditrichota bacterium]